MQNFVIESKLYIPKVRPAQVIRQELIRKLENVPAGICMLISAPAGYGKTSLLAEWANSIQHPIAWLSLDTSENDFQRFSYYLDASSLQKALSRAAVLETDISSQLRKATPETICANC